MAEVAADSKKLFDQDLAEEKYDPELDDLPIKKEESSPKSEKSEDDIKELKDSSDQEGNKANVERPVSKEEQRSLADSDEEPMVESGSSPQSKQSIEEEKETKEERKKVSFDGNEKIMFPEASNRISGTANRARQDSDLEVFAEITTFMKAAHVTYTIKGYDRSGQFEALRRYSEFHSFHAALSSRFPGLYIPPIPPKKAVGNTDINFVIERRYFLDRFLSLICEVDYLAQSEEFKLFLRHSFEYDKALSTLPKTSYEYLVDKYRSDLMVDQLPQDELSRCADQIRHFASFIKKSQSFLQALKKQVKGMIPQKEQENSNYGTFCQMLCKYEESALSEYCNHSEGHFIIRGSPVEKDLEELPKNLKNPFKEVYFWLKGECYDCFAILEMIRSREKLIDQRVRSEKKKNEERHTLEKLQAGKKTMKSIFSTKSNADQMNAYATSITKLERDIEALEEINQIVTVYIAKTVIPKLKKDKMQAYYKIIKKFSSIQSEQATALSEIWTQILSSTNLKHF